MKTKLRTINALIISALIFFPSFLYSQILYYSDTFNGGTTASGWAPGLGGSGSGNFDIQIYPGATIHQAFLIGCGHGDNNNFTVTLNSDNITFTAANEASSFPDPTYLGDCIVSIVDVTSIIDPAVNDYTITVPFQDQSNGFEGYMLYVAYEDPSLDLINTYLYLNDQPMAPTAVTWNLTDMEPFPSSGNIAVSMLFDYACNWNGDAEWVDVNGTYIGNCGGVDYNSGNCASILGSYYYENGVAYGLGNDTPDNSIAEGDALWIADSFVSAGDTGMDLVMYDGPNYEGFDNGFYLGIFTYGSSCDIPPYTVSADTSICPGQSTQLEATGGTAYTWSPAATLDNASSDSPIATPALSTTYEVLIDFANGCSITEEVTVEVNVNSLQFEVDIVPPLCDGTGSMEITNMQGANGALTYFIDGNNQANPLFTNLSPATYDLMVNDATGCSGDTTMTLVADTYVVDFSYDATNQYCTIPGQIEVTSIDSGIGPFTIELDAVVQPDQTFENLIAGIYTVTVIDDIGCDGTLEIEVFQDNADVEYDPLIEDILCSGTGSIEITNVTGMNGNITYSLDGVVQPGPLFSNLAEGDYEVTLTDEDGCVFTQIHSVDLVIYEVDFDVTNIEVICQTPGQLEITSINSGTSPYTIELNGVVETDSLFENLTPGNYIITITDALGCNGTQNHAVLMTNPALLFDVDVTDVICQSLGTIEVLNPDGSAPYVLAVDNFPQPGLIADSLSSGEHDLLLIDSRGCIGETTVELNYIDTAAAFATYSDIIGGVPLTVDFGNESIGLNDFVWSFGNGDSAYTDVTSYTYEIPGIYTVELFGYDTINGCFDSLSFQIIADIFTIHVPNAFSPDGDGINEVFAPVGVGLDPETYLFQVFDRWGEVVFETDDLKKVWTGNVPGGEYYVASGVYIYRVEYRFLDSIDLHETMGTVTVIR